MSINNNDKKSSLLSKLMAEEEDNNGKSDLDFISLINKQDNTDENNLIDNIYNNSNKNETSNNENNSDKQNEMYVNKSFSFGGNHTNAYDTTPQKNNDFAKPFISSPVNGHSRKSSLNYTPSKDYIQPPPAASSYTINKAATAAAGSPTHTFRKTHKYKHSSVSINYNDLLNITNKIDSEDPSSLSISADQEKLHILVNKYLEFPTTVSILKKFETAAYIKASLSLLLIVLIYTTQQESMYTITITTLLQSHMIICLIKEAIKYIKADDFYTVYNFDNPFGFQRLPVLMEYAGLLYVCYRVLNLFFEFLEMIILGHGDGMHGSHSHSGHQHNANSTDDEQVIKIKYTIGFGIMVLSGLLSGYLRDWYSLLTIVPGLFLPLDGLILKIYLVVLLCSYLISKIMIIVNYLLVYLNMSTNCKPKKIDIVKQKLNQILMTEKYELKIGNITDDCCIVLIKIDKQINIIDKDIKQKIYSLMKAELNTKNIMLTVQY